VQFERTLLTLTSTLVDRQLFDVLAGIKFWVKGAVPEVCQRLLDWTFVLSLPLDIARFRWGSRCIAVLAGVDVWHTP